MHKRKADSSDQSQLKNPKPTKMSKKKRGSSSKKKLPKNLDHQTWKEVQSAIKKLQRFLKSEASLEPYLSPHWRTTFRKKHAKITYDPHTKRTLNLNREDSPTQKDYKDKEKIIDFLVKNHDEKSVIGKKKKKKKIKAAKEISIKMMEEHELAQKGPHEEDWLLCVADMNLFPSKFAHVDHFEAKSTFINSTVDPILKLMNENKKIAKFFMKDTEFEGLFIKAQYEDSDNGDSDSKPKYYGTKLLYELVFNNNENLWLLCAACNTSKSDINIIQWFKGLTQFGSRFLKHLENQGIVELSSNKILNRKEMVQEAYQWINDQFGKYIHLKQEMLQSVIKPIEEKTDQLIEEKQKILARKQSDEEESDEEEEENKKILPLQATIQSMAGATEALNRVNQNLKKHEFEDDQAKEDFIAKIRESSKKSLTHHSKEFIETEQEHKEYIQLKKTYKEKSKIPFKNRLEEIKKEKGKDKKPNKKSVFALESQLNLISKVFGKECTGILKKAPEESVKQLILNLPKLLDESITKYNTSNILST